MPRPKENSTDDLLRLSSNESPLNLSKSAQKAIVDHLPFGHRYPGKWRALFAEQLAGALGVSEENLILGAGSTEILQASVLTSTSAGQPLIVADPSFEEVPDYQQALSRRVIRVPLTANFSHDLDRMRDVVERENYHATVYICNPNNPTGNHLAGGSIMEFLDAVPERVLVVLDEAYAEYVTAADYRTFINEAPYRPNLLVTRTFSKIYGLAGLRVGYGVGSPELLVRLSHTQAPFTVTSTGQAGAIEALKYPDRVADRSERNERGRDLLSQGLTGLGFNPSESEANFIYFEPPSDAPGLGEALMSAGQIVRVLGDGIRVTVGTVDENSRFLSVLETIASR
jgi:histidinol-phosphate aminotransferase